MLLEACCTRVSDSSNFPLDHIVYVDQFVVFGEVTIEQVINNLAMISASNAFSFS